MKHDKVLMVNCPAWGVTLPSLGIAYVAADLEQRGIPCDVLDLNILLYEASDPVARQLWKMENYHLWSREDRFLEITQKFSADIDLWSRRILQSSVKTVGFSITGANILFSIEMAKAIKSKSRDICIVFGGPSCNFLHDNPRMPFRFLVSVLNGEPLIGNDVVDYVVMGEGEGAFSEVILAHRSGQPLNKAGIIPASFPVQAAIQRPSCVNDLDSLPFPAWEKFSLEKYSDKEELPILLSRGCVNRCAFCNDWGMREGAFRYRSSSNIFEEMSVMHRRFKKRVFRCHDLLFNGNLRVLDELADLIIRSDLKIAWTAQGVIRKDMDEVLLRKLSRSGLNTIVYGVETLADNVLKAMGKRFTYDDVRVVLERTKKAGINTWINLITGFPGETEQDFQLTIQRLGEIRESLDHVSSLNPCTITASSELERFPEKFSVRFRKGEDMCEHWETTDGLNTYEVRKKRAQEMFGILKNLGIKTNYVGIYDNDNPLKVE